MFCCATKQTMIATRALPTKTHLWPQIQQDYSTNMHDTNL